MLPNPIEWGDRVAFRTNTNAVRIGVVVDVEPGGVLRIECPDGWTVFRLVADVAQAEPDSRETRRFAAAPGIP